MNQEVALFSRSEPSSSSPSTKLMKTEDDPRPPRLDIQISTRLESDRQDGLDSSIGANRAYSDQNLASFDASTPTSALQRALHHHSYHGVGFGRPPHHPGWLGAQTASSVSSISSPKDLVGIKLSKVKATAALFESRSISNSSNNSPSLSPSPSISCHHRRQLTTHGDHGQKESKGLEGAPPDEDGRLERTQADLLLPPSTSTSSSSLRLSSGIVNQIKAQFLHHHQRRHQGSKDQVTPSSIDLGRYQQDYRRSIDQSDLNRPNHVLKNYDARHLDQLSQSIRSISLDLSRHQSTPPSSRHKPHPSPRPIPPTSQRPLSDDNSLDRSDSDSTSTSHHPQSSICTNSLDQQSDNLLLEQEPPQPQPQSQLQSTPSPPVHHSHRHHQQQPSRSSQEILSDIATLSLSARITELAMSIQEVALALFEVQELRHSSASNNLESNSSPSHSSMGASDRCSSGSALTQVDKALMRLEKKVETTANEFVGLGELIRPYRTLDGPNSDQAKLLNDKFDTILEDWERIQRDTELLKDELKEDKWLVVFRAVSSQAEEMMESLEKVLHVSEEFIRETNRRLRRRSNPPSHHSPASGSKLKANRDSLGSSSSSSDRHETEELMKSYNSLLKNFHAKNKHYVPSCERVLGILSKGIKSRSTKNGEVLRRYADMNDRFTHIREKINKVGLDLVGVEKLLQHACAIFSDSASSPDGPAQQPYQELSLLQPPTPNLHTPTPSPSPGASKTRKALSTLSTQSISPFKKIASKFTSSSTPSVSSQRSSICSTAQTPPSVAVNGLTPNSNSSGVPHRPLRSFRSTLNQGYASITRLAKPTGNLTPNNLPLEPRRPSSTLPEPITRSRPGTRQTNYQHTPSSDKPRWNISLKRIEDTPPSMYLSNSNNARRLSTVQSLAKSYSGAVARATTPSSNNGNHHAGHHQLLRNGGFGPGNDRPGSAAGRSEASGTTTLSMPAYRSRPPSRHSRIPVPVWDPMMQSRRNPSRGSFEGQDLPRPCSRSCATPNLRSHLRPSTSPSHKSIGLYSPTESDIAKLPALRSSKVSIGRSDSRRLSQGSMNGRKSMGGIEGVELEQLLEQIESEEPNPSDPLDMMIHQKCREQISKVILRRIDSPLSRNPEKAKLAGAGIGDQARYSFWFIGIGRTQEEKSVMCKLVESKRISLHQHHQPSSHLQQHPLAKSSSHPPLHVQGELKVLVRTRSGWRDLDLYLLDCQQQS